jgi:hypothetical protein
MLISEQKNSTFKWPKHFRRRPFGCEQGDQIGRIFNSWVIVYFGKFFLITEAAQIFGAAIFI